MLTQEFVKNKNLESHRIALRWIDEELIDIENQKLDIIKEILQ